MASSESTLPAFRLSWWWTDEQGGFELHSPWWISGEREDGARSVVAAVRAPSEVAAKYVIMAAYDTTPSWIDWRFCEERPEGWAPYSGRFPRAGWMQWA